MASRPKPGSLHNSSSLLSDLHDHQLTIFDMHNYSTGQMLVDNLDSKLDPRYSMLSRIEFQDAQRIFRENDLYLVFVTIEINNTALCVASFTHARVHVHVFPTKVQIVSLEVKR